MEELSTYNLDAYTTRQSQDIDHEVRQLSDIEASLNALDLDKARVEKKIGEQKVSLAIERLKLKQAKAKKERILGPERARRKRYRKHPVQHGESNATKVEHAQNAASIAVQEKRTLIVEISASHS